MSETSHRAPEYNVYEEFMTRTSPRSPDFAVAWKAAAVWLLLATLCVAKATAQERFRFDRLGPDEGLSQVSAHSIVQDRRGFIWIATEEGLNRFDGYDVIVYKHDPEDPDSLYESYIDSIAEDRAGGLWIRTNAGNLNHFDPETGRSIRYSAVPDGPRSLGGPTRASGFYAERDHVVWVSVLGDGVRRIDGDRVVRIAQGDVEDGGLPGERVFFFYEDRQGDLWLATSGGLARRRQPVDGIERFDSYEVDAEDPQHLGQVVTSLYEDRQGEFYVGTWGHGVLRFDRRCDCFERLPQPEKGRDVPTALIPVSNQPANRIFAEDGRGGLWAVFQGGLLRWDSGRQSYEIYRHEPDLPGSLSAGQPTILGDSSGDVWVAFAQGGGLNRYDPVNDTFQRFVPDPTDNESLPAGFVVSIMEDRSGVLWLGTASNGAARWSRRKHLFRHYKHPVSNVAKLNDNIVFAVFVDRDGHLWTGLQAGGARRYDKARQEVIEHYHQGAPDGRDIGSDYVRAFHQDDDGFIWVGLSGAGLARIDPNLGQVTGQWRHRPDDPSSLPHNVVRGLAGDREGRIWVTTPGGVAVMDRDRQAFQRFVIDRDDPRGPPAIIGIYRDKADDIWIGGDNGISRYVPESGDFEVYRHDPNDPSTIPLDVVLSFWDNGAGRLYMATYGGGLVWLDRASGIFSRLTTHDGLPSNSLYTLVPDDNDGLWMSHNQGISRLDLNNGTFRNYDKDHGLQANEFSGRSAFRTSQGEILFGGINGVTAFYPDEILDERAGPPVVLTVLEKLENGGFVSQSLDGVERVELSYKNRIFGIGFAALDYHFADKSRYAYRLEGFDRDWVDAGTRHSAAFTNLSGGSYRFRVRAANSDGVWGEEEATIDVVIVPPLWKRWWAYCFYTVGVLGLVWTFSRHRRQRQVEEMQRVRRDEELAQARQIQRSMLPEAPPDIDGFEFAVSMRTAQEVGGDYYDFFPRPDGSVYVALGDATGHGIPAGMMVAMTRSLLKALEISQPDVLLSRLNRVFREVHPGRIKMALNALQATKESITFASAGMPPLYHFHADTGAVDEILISGLPLGSLAELNFTKKTIAISPGDTIVLLSDGLPETPLGRDTWVGYEAIVGCLKEHGRKSAEAVLAELLALGGNIAGSPDDDVTVMVIKRC